ncbi:MAG: MFS transporter [Actinobacteria bacterium]|nr:MFS transporter [Actinomycetota bacterium]
MPSLETQTHKNRALILLALTQFMIVIDASITNVALPTIGRALEIDQTNLSWVVNAYTLTFGGFLLLGGRLADLIGRRRMFIIGLAIFGASSLLGGLAGSAAFLDGARALQGIGAAFVSPAALALVTTIFAEGSERNRALGVWGAVAGAGGAAGVLLGGILTEIDWRLVLFVNVPVAIGAIIAAPRILPAGKDPAEVKGFDIPGAISVTAGLALLVFAMIKASEEGWATTGTIARLAGSALLLLAFVVIELRAEHPLLPFSIFRLRTLRGANLAGVLTGMSMFSAFLFISYYLQYVLGYSAIETGLAYLPFSVEILTAALAAQLVTRIGFKPTLIGGLLVLAAGLFWFSRISTSGSYLTDVLGPMVVAGCGLGLTFVPIMIAAVTGTSGPLAGVASGLINTSLQVGGALGIAILVSVSSSRIAEFGPAAGTDHALVAGYSRAFLVGSGLAVLAALLSTVIISSKDSREHSEAARRDEAPVADI